MALAILQRLDRSNLFVVPLDDRLPVVPLPRLFADVLRAYLEEEHSDQIPDLHHRASEWYEQHGERAEAIRHALAGDELGAAHRAWSECVARLERAGHVSDALGPPSRWATSAWSRGA